MGPSHFNIEKNRKIFTLFYRKPLEVIQLMQCKNIICSRFGVRATILAATFTVTFTAYDSFIRWLWVFQYIILFKQTNYTHRLCSHYTEKLLRRHENHTGLGFCSHIKTVVAARFLWRSKAAPRRCLKCRVKYRRGVHTISYSFCAATNIISDWASVHT